MMVRVAAHACSVALSWLALFGTFAGWGAWLRRLVPRPARAAEVILTGLAGGCLGFLLLQDLVYAGIPLRYGAWVGAAAAALGLVRLGLPGRLGRARALWAPAAGVLAAGCFVQGIGLLYQGPSHYYGYGRQDQVNYVDLAQFLMDRPYGTTGAQIGLHPWLVKALDTKDRRIGEAIVNGYAAVITGTDAQAAYGPASVFLVALAGVAVFGLLEAAGVARGLAALTGCWTSVLPGVAQMHLDGFFSQAAVLFVLPALALAAAVGGRPSGGPGPALAIPATGLLVGFLFGAYTELFAVGAALAVALGLVAPGLDRWARAIWVAVAAASPALLLPRYFWRGIGFMAEQYRGAERNGFLALWTPRAGTWRGWAELFIAAPQRHPAAVAAASVAGFGVLLLMASALLARESGRRRLVAPLLLVPAGVLLAIAVKRPFPQYPFGKLCVSFLPLATALATLGLIRWVNGRLAALALAAGLALAVACTWTKQQVVVRRGAGLGSVDLPSARATYAAIVAHPERRYVIAETHYIINAWLCYYARASDTYVAVSQIGDRALAKDEFAFQRPWTAAGPPIYEATAWGLRRLP